MLKANHVHQKKLWVELLIPIGKRNVIVNTLSFYFYTLTNINYYLKEKYYEYFHPDVAVDKEAFHSECKKQRRRYVDKLNAFVDDLKYLFKTPLYKLAVSGLVNELNLKDKKKEAAEISEILLSNQQTNNDKSIQRQIAKVQTEALKNLVHTLGKSDKVIGGHVDKVFTLLKQGITTIHV